jgi:hypothetical protein
VRRENSLAKVSSLGTHFRFTREQGEPDDEADDQVIRKEIEIV